MKMDLFLIFTLENTTHLGTRLFPPPMALLSVHSPRTSTLPVMVCQELRKPVEILVYFSVMLFVLKKVTHWGHFWFFILKNCKDWAFF